MSRAFGHSSSASAKRNLRQSGVGPSSLLSLELHGLELASHPRALMLTPSCASAVVWQMRHSFIVFGNVPGTMSSPFACAQSISPTARVVTPRKTLRSGSADSYLPLGLLSQILRKIPQRLLWAPESALLGVGKASLSVQVMHQEARSPPTEDL